MLQEDNEMIYGKSIELFLVNGSADSLVTAELSNWNGKAIRIPRTEIASCNRTDITQAGVYFLFCKQDDDTEAVYIGESENIKERLVQHIRDFNADKEKYYWNTAVIFIGSDLNKSLIRYLEDRFVTIAKQCKRYTVLTKNTYSKTVIKESQKAAMEEFIDNVKIVINALGYNVLEPKAQPEADDTENMLFMNYGSAKAKGKRTSDGFVVLTGSTINATTTKACPDSAIKNRAKYGKSIDENYTLTDDLLFSSPSGAAAFVGGSALSGNELWKDQNGTKLKDIDSV